MDVAAPPIGPTALAEPIGELWTLTGSPYSARVRYVLSWSGRVATHVAFTPVVSPAILWMRMGFPLRFAKITAPVLIVYSALSPQRFIRDSSEIAAYMDAAREPSRPTLFPNEKAAIIAEFIEHADALFNFGRRSMLEALAKDPTAAERIIPPELRGLFFTRPLLRVVLYLFNRKYSAESAGASRARALRSLHALRSALSSSPATGLKYVAGERLTYADIVMVSSLYFDPKRQGTSDIFYEDKDFQDEFPDLIAWGEAVRLTHFPVSNSGSSNSSASDRKELSL